MGVYLDDGSGGLVNQPQNQVAFTTAPAATAPTNSSPYGFGQTQAQAILDNVIAMRLALIAAGIMKSS